MGRRDRRHDNRKKRGARSGGESSLQHRDAFLRMNFLVQAAALMTLTTRGTTPNLARMYVRTLKRVAAKDVIRIDPSIKRTLCKRCDAMLIPGLTSTFSELEKPELMAATTCLECNQMKRFPCREDHRLFSEVAVAKDPEQEVEAEADEEPENEDSGL